MHKLLAAVLAGALVCSTSLPAAAEIDEAAAEALMRDSGVWKELGEVSSQVHASLQRALADGNQQRDEKVLQRMESSVDAAYAPERLRTAAREALQNETDKVYMPEIRDWYRSELGTKIANIEDAAPADRDERNKLTEQGADLLKKTLPSRRALLEGIVEASRAVEITSKITINSTLSALRAVSRANPEAPVPTEEKLVKELDAARPRIEQAMTTEFLQVCASMYASVSDDHLRAYAKFLDSPAGRHLSDVLASAVDTAMSQGARRLGREIVPSKGLAA